MIDGERHIATIYGRFVLCILGLMIAETAVGQPQIRLWEDYVVRTFTTAQGLPSNYVVQVLQTRDGYIWLATSAGLVRFNGLTFTTFDREHTEGLQNSSIVELFEDREGGLWIAQHPTGLARLVDGEAVDMNPPFAAAARFFQDRQGAVWIANDQGLARFYEGRFIRYTTADGLPDLRINQIVEDGSGILWILTLSGLAKYEQGHFTTYTVADGFPTNQINSMFVDREGVLWVSSHLGLARYKQDRFVFYTEEDGLPRTGFHEVRQGRDGTYWIGSDIGLITYRDGRFSVLNEPSNVDVNIGLVDQVGAVWLYTERFDVPGQFKNGQFSAYPLGGQVGSDGVYDRILGIFEDREGNLWLPKTTGLDQLVPVPIRVPAPTDGFPERMIRPIYETASGALWLGTWGDGLYRFYEGTVSHFTIPGGTRHNQFWAIHEDPEGTLWFGSDEGLLRLSAASGTFEPVINGDVRAVYTDRDGVLWFGRNRAEPEGNRLYRIENETPLQYAFDRDSNNVDVWAIHEDRSGTLWVGTQRGLIQIKDDRTRVFTTADGLSQSFVVSIYEEADGTLWFGTRDEGINHYRNGRFTVVAHQHGLYSNGVWKMLEDDAGRIWMSSDRGLFQVNRQDLQDFVSGQRDHIVSIVYTETDGLPSAEFNRAQPAGWKTGDGRLWFPGIKGAVTVDPNEIRPTALEPPVVIESVLVNGQLASANQLTALPPGPKNLEIHFAALSYAGPEKNQYRYKLEGVDPDWRDADTRQVAFYANLDAGTYTFYVTASNNKGVWNTAGRSLTVTIKPFFYETIWFYLLTSGLLLGIGTLAYRYQMKRVREWELTQMVAERTRELEQEKEKTEAQARRLTELDEIKSRFFANVSHEFRTPITLILGPIRDALEQEHDLPLAQLSMLQRSGLRLLRLVNQLQDLSKIEAGKLVLKPGKRDLIYFLRQCVAMFESLATTYRINLYFASDQESLVHGFDGERLEQVMLNLLGNAVKNTTAGGTIRITVHSSGREHPVIEVQDTGVGIAPEHLSYIFDPFYQINRFAAHERQGSGIGLALVREIIELHGGTVAVESTIGVGSVFTIELPSMDAIDDTQDIVLDPDHEANPVMPPIDLISADLAATRADPVPSSDNSDLHSNTTVILLIDDNGDLRSYMRTILQDEGRIEEAENGFVGLERARHLVPDIIIADVMMPELDGFEVCRQVKADPVLDHIPVLLVTARATEESKLEGLEIGADDYLYKPFNAEELRIRVRNLIESRRRLQDRYRQEVMLRIGNEPIISVDRAFLERAQEVVVGELDNSYFGVEEFALAMGLSSRQLQRKFRALVNVSPNQFIRMIRLRRGADLLEQNAGTVAEIAYRVGFNHATYFATAFREEYGCAPSEWSGKDTEPDA